MSQVFEVGRIYKHKFRDILVKVISVGENHVKFNLLHYDMSLPVHSLDTSILPRDFNALFEATDEEAGPCLICGAETLGKLCDGCHVLQNQFDQFAAQNKQAAIEWAKMNAWKLERH